MLRSRVPRLSTATLTFLLACGAGNQFRKVTEPLSTTTRQFTWQTAHDYCEKSSDAYGVRGIPHLVLIGRDGKVINAHRKE
ncbi:MAG: hypothetical protein ABL931_08620 [Usitatibacteraceae bacterium]